MTQIVGNSYQKKKLERVILDQSVQVVALVGKSYLGKRSFLINYFSDHCEDHDLIYIKKSNQDEFLEQLKLVENSSFSTEFKVVIFDELDTFSNGQQSILLKLFEEPPSYLKIFIICEDTNNLIDPINSRVQFCSNWGTVLESEMDDFINSSNLVNDYDAKLIADNRPGIYEPIIRSLDTYKLILTQLDLLIKSDKIDLFSNFLVIDDDHINRDILCLISSHIFKQNFGQYPEKCGFLLSFCSAICKERDIKLSIIWNVFLYELLKFSHTS